ncbi:double zinc ribbon domain-containing protein [Clostridium sp.]|uniref:double zinc ribbon domain-containing protein n=1 Tax=Clostridium sp. TaxID=1506 RepID=UPI003D6D2085
MLTCDKCNASLEDGSEYCSECGSKVYETIYCTECGEKTTSQFDLCQKCGKPLGTGTSQKLSTEKAREKGSFKSKLSLRFSKKNAIVCLVG